MASSDPSSRDTFKTNVAGLEGVFQGNSITALVVFRACSRTKLSSLAPGTHASLCSLTLAPVLELLVSSSGISAKKRRSEPRDHTSTLYPDNYLPSQSDRSVIPGKGPEKAIQPASGLKILAIDYVADSVASRIRPPGRQSHLPLSGLQKILMAVSEIKHSLVFLLCELKPLSLAFCCYYPYT